MRRVVWEGARGEKGREREWEEKKKTEGEVKQSFDENERQRERRKRHSNRHHPSLLPRSAKSQTEEKEKGGEDGSTREEM